MSSTPTPTPGQPSPRRPQVLLVEDDIALGDALKTALAEDGTELVVATDGPSALERLSVTPFTLVLLDIGLPGLDGFEVLRRLRADSRWERLPVIVLTAAHSVDEKLKGFELGANDYVTKPFEWVELRARVRAAVRAQRLQAELTAARSSAEESARAKADFLANMSHEIRTPMNGVIAMTGLLLQTELGPEQRDFVETIRTSGESLTTIIDDILNFSKLESGKMELEQRPFNLRECIEGTLDMLAPKAAEKNLDLAYQLSPVTPEEVTGDITRTRQILINLINNAIKFTPSGEIFIQVEGRPAHPNAPGSGGGLPLHELHFIVRDTGIGIPQDRLGRLFKSFSQTDSSISRQFGGTGLGLAISKGLAELMGGRMWVESEEGKGSQFHFTFRLPAALSSTAAQNPLNQPQASLSGLRVLLVDNNATVRRVLADQARAWGMTPVEAPTAQHALDQMRAGASVDLAIIDCGLAGVQGDILAVELRKNSRLRDLPVVLLSRIGGRPASTQPDLGRTVTVTKPLRLSQLQSAVIQVRSGTLPVVKNSQPTSRMDANMASRMPLRILLADDNVINQKVALRLLQQLGYKASTANNGHDAVRAVEQQGFDLIFMDVQMPEVDGLEATRRIRQYQQQHPSAPPIVIIAMTANAMQGDREKCMAAGMDDYLPKPVRPEALQAMLEKHGARAAAAGAVAPGAEPSPETKSAAQPSPASAGAPAPRATASGPAVGRPSRPAKVPTAAAETRSRPTGYPPHLKVLPGSADGPAPTASSPAVPSTVVEPPPVDMERLNEFAGGSLENYNELVNLYIKQTQEQLQQIREALATADATRASRVAHSCAGASATCGMSSIVPLLRRMECLTHEGKAEEATLLLPGIQVEFDRIQNYLQTHKPIALAS